MRRASCPVWPSLGARTASEDGAIGLARQAVQLDMRSYLNAAFSSRANLTPARFSCSSIAASVARS